MTLRKKIFSFVFPLLLALFFLSYGILSKDLLARIESTQKAESIEHALLIERLFFDKIKNLSSKSADWSQWDDTYSFMENRNEEYLVSNMNDASFRAIGVNVIALYDTDGNLVYGKKVFGEESTNDITSFEGPFSRIVPQVLAERIYHDGFFVENGKIVLVTAGPITMSDGSGDSRGALFFARYFDLELIGQLTEISGLRVSTLLSGDSFFRNEDERRIVLEQLSGSGRREAIFFNRQSTAGYFSVPDIFLQQRVVFRVESDPVIYRTGYENVLLFGRMMFGVGALFFLLVFVVLEIFVLRRLRLLNTELERVESTDSKVSLPGTDEFSRFAGVINSAFGRIETANALLASEKARAEGILKYLQSIGEAVYATDKNGMIVFSNATAGKMLGCDPKDLVMTHASELFRFFSGKDDDRKEIFPVHDVLEEKASGEFSSKVFLLRPNGALIPVSGTYSPLLEQGHVVGAVVVFQDVTERYELEKLKDNFLSVAAHQLRTPLGSMRWSMELLKDGDYGKISKGVQDALEELYQNSGRMLALVDDLLDVSRIDRDKGHEESSEVDCFVLLEDVFRILKGEAEKRAISLTLRKGFEGAAHPVIFAPKKHLFEAFENLVSNAIRYNRPSGSVDVLLDIEGDSIVVSIKDTGIGIPKKDIPKLFTKFFRASNTADSSIDGTGLGLFVVRSYVEECGGTVSFESEEGVGTTFYVRLPVIRK